MKHYLTTFRAGPLNGRTIAVYAKDDWQAMKMITDALGLGATDCADWPREGPPDVFTITIDEAVAEVTP